MADTKITDLTALAQSSIVIGTDVVPIVDISDTSMAASGTTKKATPQSLVQASLASLTATADTTPIGLTGYSLTGSNASSLIDLAGTWNTSGTPTAIKLNVTDTASNAASLLMDLQVGGVSTVKITKSGTIYATLNTTNYGTGDPTGGSDGDVYFKYTA